jgi:hypothetical protein
LRAAVPARHRWRGDGLVQQQGGQENGLIDQKRRTDSPAFFISGSIFLRLVHGVLIDTQVALTVDFNDAFFQEIDLQVRHMMRGRFMHSGSQIDTNDKKQGMKCK